MHTGFYVLVTDALAARVTGNDMGRTVGLLVNRTRGLISLTKYLAAGSTVSSVVLTDVFAASTAGFQMFGREQIFAVSTFRCVIQATDFGGVSGGDGVSRAKRIFTDGTDAVVLGANALTGMGTCLVVVMTNDAITVRAVSNEGNTVGVLALGTRLCVRIAECSVVI